MLLLVSALQTRTFLKLLKRSYLQKADVRSEGVGNINAGLLRQNEFTSDARIYHQTIWDHSFAPQGSCIRLNTKGGRIKSIVRPEVLNAWIPDFQREFFDYSLGTECTHTHRDVDHPGVKGCAAQREGFLPKTEALFPRLPFYQEYSPLSSSGDKEKAAPIAQKLLSHK